MPQIKKKYKLWDTESYFIEAIIENLWWENIISEYFEQKLALIVNEIIVNTDNENILKKFSISILFTGDKKITQLNKKFKKINFPTNILSFPAARNMNADNFLNNNDNFLGDIVISSGTLIKEANSEKKKPIDHLIHLFIHGVLHLLGYDHENSYEAKIMEALEVKILKNLNISNPYLDNT
ncbi:rRNA maturation RNase YbeY [Alphaproteobacteria bacterium]|nr:rRNA maturation RNase YbeY [Alphaproteobacteria bacterium]